MEMEDVKTLLDAAMKNDVPTLDRLIQQDPLILEKATLMNCQEDMNPLHVAVTYGSVEFVKEILRISPDMCLAFDRCGRNPLHLAVIKGRIDVLEELVEARPQAARAKAEGGGNALHLCVKYDKLKALELLLSTIKDKDFANRKDDEGMTILHLAVCYGKIEMIKYLTKKNRVRVKAKSAVGSTALDLFHKGIDRNIVRSLKKVGARRGSTVEEGYKWLSKKKGALLVVASLVATMAFQAGINPPGSVWQENSNNSIAPSPSVHFAGEAVLGSKRTDLYGVFIICNTVAFVSSLSTILFLISGFPFRHKFFLGVLLVILWVTIVAIGFTYLLSVSMLLPDYYQLDGTLAHY